MFVFDAIELPWDHMSIKVRFQTFQSMTKIMPVQ